MHSMESIKFQDPKLFTDLVTELKSIYAALPARDPSMPYLTRVQQITFFLETGPYLDALKKIIVTHTGLPVDSLVSLASTDPTAVYSVGFRHATHRNVKREQIALLSTLAKMSAVLDGDMGIVKDIDGLYDTLSITHIVISGALFCVGEYFPDCALSAENIAAVILHELGHAYDTVERWYRVGQICALSDSLIQYTGTEVTPQSVDNVLAACEIVGKKIPHKLPEVATLLDGLPGLREEIKTKSFTVSELLAIQGYVVGAIGIAAGTIGGVDVGYQPTMSTTRCVDRVRTTMERNADVYAMRMGAGVYLTQVLMKLRHYYINYKTPDVGSINTIAQTTSLFQNVSVWKTIESSVDMAPCQVSGQYDAELTRFKEQLHTLYGAFANAELPDTLKAQLSDQIKDISTLITKWSQRTDVKFRQMLFQGIRTFLTKGPLGFFLYRNQLDDRYSRLTTMSRDLVDNPLFYHGYLVDKVLENMSKRP